MLSVAGDSAFQLVREIELECVVNPVLIELLCFASYSSFPVVTV